MTNILPFNSTNPKQTRAAIHDDLVCVPEITTAVAFHWVEDGTEHFYASEDGTDDMSAIAHTVELTECRFERIELPEDDRDHLYSVTAQCSIDGVAGEMVFVARVSYDQRITALGAQYSPTHALRLLFASFGGWVCQEARRIQEAAEAAAMFVTLAGIARKMKNTGLNPESVLQRRAQIAEYISDGEGSLSPSRCVHGGGVHIVICDDLMAYLRATMPMMTHPDVTAGGVLWLPSCSHWQQNELYALFGEQGLLDDEDDKKSEFLIFNPVL